MWCVKVVEHEEDHVLSLTSSPRHDIGVTP